MLQKCTYAQYLPMQFTSTYLLKGLCVLVSVELEAIKVWGSAVGDDGTPMLVFELAPKNKDDLAALFDLREINARLEKLIQRIMQ